MYEGVLRHRPPPVFRRDAQEPNDVAERFDSTEAAPTLPDLVPKGEYEVEWRSIKQNQNTNGKPRAVLMFEIVAGEFTGKRIWYDLYLTPAATPRSKRELEKLGITKFEEIQGPVPHWLRCSLRVVVETGDDRKQRNKIADFKVIRFDEEPPEPFAPKCEGGAS